METPTEEQKTAFVRMGRSLQNLAAFAARQQNSLRPKRHILTDSVKVALRLEDNWKVRLKVTYAGDVYESVFDYGLLTLYKTEDLPMIFAKELERLVAKI